MSQSLNLEDILNETDSDSADQAEVEISSDGDQPNEDQDEPEQQQETIEAEQILQEDEAQEVSDQEKELSDQGVSEQQTEEPTEELADQEKSATSDQDKEEEQETEEKTQSEPIKKDKDEESKNEILEQTEEPVKDEVEEQPASEVQEENKSEESNEQKQDPIEQQVSKSPEAKVNADDILAESSSDSFVENADDILAQSDSDSQDSKDLNIQQQPSDSLVSSEEPQENGAEVISPIKGNNIRRQSKSHIDQDQLEGLLQPPKEVADELNERKIETPMHSKTVQFDTLDQPDVCKTPGAGSTGQLKTGNADKKVIQQSASPAKEDKKKDDGEISDDERARILRELDLEDSDDDDEDEESQSEGEEDLLEDDQTSDQKKKRPDKGSEDSFVSDEDFLNRSLQSDGEGEEIVDPINFLRYSSGKENLKQDLLDIVDKNERSFKQVAEKMIEQTSQLTSIIQQNEEESQEQSQQFSHMTNFPKVANRFHGDVKVAQGVPFSIAALEEFIAIGSSDGFVRLFDANETEIKVCHEHKLKGNAVTCLDLQRLLEERNVFVVSGHIKGHVALYEVKGLLQHYHQMQVSMDQTAYNQMQQALFTNVTFKHLKTVNDIHESPITQVKFFGDFRYQCQIISCDLRGVIYITNFSDGFFGWSADKQCLIKKRLGATFSCCPFIQIPQNPNSFDQNQFQKQLNSKKEKNKPFRGSLIAKDPEVTQEEIKSKCQLIALGSNEEVYVAQIMPKPITLASIRRPAYIQAGIVPYLDWGFALTPTYRDQAYKTLAIAWGRTIQLCVITNFSDVDRGLADPEFEFDGFYICDGFSIDQVFFVSESLLFIIVNKKECRILYTQNFTPGMFEPNYKAFDLSSRKFGGNNKDPAEQESIQNFTKTKEAYAGQVSAYAEKEKGSKLLEDEIRHKDLTQFLQQGELGSKFNFNTTICKNHEFSVLGLGKVTVGQRKLLHWEEHLNLIRIMNPNDWLKVLKVALEIFGGKKIGLAGLPDNQEMREHMLRSRMQDLLRQNINACIKEFQEGECVSRKTLRVSMEFCIRIGAVDHLFGELFTMFAEAGMEQRFFENLDAFVLSGKFKKVKIPEPIIIRLIAYYEQKDVELLEKAILNFDLTTFPNTLDVKKICEEQLLTSAIIHLMNTIFDDTRENSAANVCMSILCSIFNILERCDVIVTREEILSLPKFADLQGTSIFDASSTDVLRQQPTEEELLKTKQFQEQRQEKLRIEHSKTYITYKILWLVKLFLEGKRFPAGQLSVFKWHCYVFDIVRFFTNKQFLVWFLQFDPESFFQILKKLYLEQEAYDFIQNQESFVAMYAAQVPGLEQCATLVEIIEVVSKNVDSLLEKEKEENGGKLTSKGEALQNSFMFFVTQVSRRIRITYDLAIKIIFQQIDFHKKLIKIDKQLLMKLIPQTQAAKAIKSKTQNIYLYLIKKNEADILLLVQQIYRSLSKNDLQELLDAAKDSPLFKLQVFLHQIRSIKQEVFAWLNEIQNSFVGEEGAPIAASMAETNYFNLNVPSSIPLTKVKELLMQNMVDFVQMSPEETIKICEHWFQADYMAIADELKDSKELAFNFLNTIIIQSEDRIIREYNHNMILLDNSSSTSQPSQKWNRIILRLVDILCEKKFRNRITEYVARIYFPIDETLAICEKRGATEACAVLFKRKGQYENSILKYGQVLNELSQAYIIYTLYLDPNVPYNDPNTKNEHIRHFDGIILQIIKICDKYGSRSADSEKEKLWLFALKCIYQVSDNLKKAQGEDKDNSSEDDDQDEIEKFEIFMKIRTQMMMKTMNEHVNLGHMVEFLSELGHELKYDEFKVTFEDKVRTQCHTEKILFDARALVDNDLLNDYLGVLKIRQKGALQEIQRCSECNLQLLNKFDQQDVWLFDCGHCFHARCVEKHDGLCSKCFNELDVIQSLSVIKKKGSKQRKRSDSENAEEAADIHEITSIQRKASMRQSKKQADVRNAERVVLTSEQKLIEKMKLFEIEQRKVELNLDSFNFNVI